MEQAAVNNFICNNRHYTIIFSGKSKICCFKCQKKCSGEVLRVSDKYFHKQCFQCFTCRKSLATGGFFSKDNSFYCTSDYQKLFGTRCVACKMYVEGEVVFTMGEIFHQKVSNKIYFIDHKIKKINNNHIISFKSVSLAVVVTNRSNREVK